MAVPDQAKIAGDHAFAGFSKFMETNVSQVSQVHTLSRNQYEFRKNLLYSYLLNYDIKFLMLSVKIFVTLGLFIDLSILITIFC